MKLIKADIKYYKDYFQLWSNVEVIKYTNRKLLASQSDCYKFLEKWLEVAMDKVIPNQFVIEADNKIVGICGYPIISKEKFKCGIYYQIKQKYWGRGYGTEAAEILLTEIEKNFKNGKIIADAVSENSASLKILKNLGFIQTNIEEKAFKVNESQLDIIHFQKNISKN